MDSITEKTCTLCCETKPLTEFYAQRDCRAGVKNQCKACYAARNNKQRDRPDAPKYTYPHYIHEWRIRWKYGLTLAEHDEMYAQQNGVCAICGLPETGLGRGGKVRRMATDHNHLTGAIRGLLCHSCNFILGSCKENPDILRKAADYLERYK